MRELQRVLPRASCTAGKGESERERIKGIIHGIIDGMNRGDLRPIFGARSNRHFSLFDDFPPFFEMDRPVEDDHVVVTVKAIKQNHIRINELEILTLGGSALATMYISSTFAIADRIKTSKSSVTLVFAKERGWKIVHEHWSPLETWDIGYSTDRFAQPDKPPGMQRVPTTG